MGNGYRRRCGLVPPSSKPTPSNEITSPLGLKTSLKAPRPSLALLRAAMSWSRRHFPQA